MSHLGSQGTLSSPTGLAHRLGRNGERGGELRAARWRSLDFVPGQWGGLGGLFFSFILLIYF